MEYVNRIKEFRKKSRMTQIDTAKELGISQAQFSKLEKGQSLCNANQILRMCELFKCTPNDLLGFRGVHTMTYADIDDRLDN